MRNWFKSQIQKVVYDIRSSTFVISHDKLREYFPSVTHLRNTDGYVNTVYLADKPLL